MLRADAAPLTGRLLAGLGIALAAALVRLPPCFGDLWMDEIWTVMAAQSLRSPLEAFTAFQSSSNHPSSTWIVHVLAFGDSPAVYRLYSLLAGAGTVALAWSAQRRHGRLEGGFAVLLTGASYPLIHFSSELRGYALVVFFGIATKLAAWRFCEDPRWGRAAAIWACAALGIVSHLTYLFALLAALAGSALRLCDACASRREAALAFARAFGVPLALLALYRFGVIRHFEIGGGEPFVVGEVLVKTLSYAGGGPGAGPLALAVAVVTAGLFALGIAQLWRRSRSEGLFYAIAVFLAPAAVLTLLRPDVLSVRYFAIDLAFGLLALSALLADAWRRGGPTRLAVALGVLLFLVGNTVNVARLYRFGRGAYAEGLRFMAEQTPQPVLTVTSDHDARNGMILEYYAPRSRPPLRIEYLPGSLQFPVRPLAQPPAPSAAFEPAPGAEWMIFHRIDDPGEMPPSVADRHGTVYELERTLPYSDLSGWSWFLYRKRGRPAGAPGD